MNLVSFVTMQQPISWQETIATFKSSVFVFLKFSILLFWATYKFMSLLHDNFLVYLQD